MAPGLSFFDISYFIEGSWGYNEVENKLKIKTVVTHRLVLMAIKADINKVIHFLTYC